MMGSLGPAPVCAVDYLSKENRSVEVAVGLGIRWEAGPVRRRNGSMKWGDSTCLARSCCARGDRIATDAPARRIHQTLDQGCLSALSANIV